MTEFDPDRIITIDGRRFYLVELVLRDGKEPVRTGTYVLRPLPGDETP